MDVRVFPHPDDINWRNVKAVSRTQRRWVKVILFLTSFLLLAFITTPSALIQLFSANSSVSDAFLKLTWTDSFPNYFKFLIKSFLPPLLVIAVNQLLLLIISYLGRISLQ